MMNSNITINHSKQNGFTLIELMVTLVLGALISAAIIQVFITSQRVDGVQRSGSEIQSAAIFGIQSMERQIRYSNIGNNGKPVSDTTYNGGIVMTTDDGTDATVIAGRKDFNVIATVGTVGGAELQTGYLTRGGNITATMTSEGGNDSWNGNSNTSVRSDQLTFQYRNDVKGTDLFDCTGAQVFVGTTVIQRYYLGIPDTTAPTKFSLMCEAGRIVPFPVPPAITGDNDIDMTNADRALAEATSFTIEDFGNGTGESVVVIDDVDQFNIRLSTSREVIEPTTRRVTAEYADYSITDYMAITGSRPFITNIKMSFLVRSASNSPEGSPESFVIFGASQNLSGNADRPKLLRRVFETSVLLRNARFIDVRVN